jgi:hypothetical protein
VSVISKHNTEHEGEGNYSKGRRVSFLIVWNTISVDYSLERGCNIVLFKVSWWVQFVRLLDVVSILVEIDSCELL